MLREDLHRPCLDLSQSRITFAVDIVAGTMEPNAHLRQRQETEMTTTKLPGERGPLDGRKSGKKAKGSTEDIPVCMLFVFVKRTGSNGDRQGERQSLPDVSNLIRVIYKSDLLHHPATLVGVRGTTIIAKQWGRIYR